MLSHLSNKAVYSFIWSFVERISVQGVGFAVSLILARLLTPEDYGVIAIIMIFTQLANVFVDCGFMKALIQNQHCSDTDYSTALLSNMGLGVTCYLILFFISPFLETFFNQQMLCDTTRVYGLVLMLSSFTVVQRAKFQKSYRFKMIALISLVSLLCGGTFGVILAVNGLGVWALVFYYLVMEFVKTVLYWILGGWKPVFSFSRMSFDKMFSFGSKLLLANLIHAIVYNLYTFVIGKVFNARSLGFFSRGQTFANLIPTNMSLVIEQASYPIFCNMQEDRNQLSSIFKKYVQISFAITAPFCVLLALLAKPLVLVILTDKWLGAVFFIQVLSIAYLFDPVMRLNAIIINTTGKSEYSLYSEIIKKSALILLIVITCPLGLKAMAFGMIVNSFLDLLSVTIYTKKIVGVRLIDELMILVPDIIFCLIMAGGVFLILTIVSNYWLQIFLGGIIGLMIYILSLYFFSREQIVYISEQTKRFINK